MAIPDYQSFMLPLLRRLAEASGPTSIKDHLESIADGYVTVTPLHLDLTHDASLAGLVTRFS